MEKLFTCEEISQKYGVQITTVWSWVRRKKIKAIKIGKEYRFSKADIDEFEKSRKTY